MQHTSDDPLALIRHIDIPGADLARWEAAGRRLETIIPAVLLLVALLIIRDGAIASVTRHRLPGVGLSRRFVEPMLFA